MKSSNPQESRPAEAGRRMRGHGRHVVRALAVVAAVATILAAGPRLAGQIARTGWTVVAWNNLGMHCMDADFSVFAILPPYNTIQAQVLDASGHLVTTDAGVRVTYEAVKDPAGSINTTSGPIGSVPKTNFWQYVQALFGALPPVDTGLEPVASPIKVQQKMPGTANTSQPMQFDASLNWFIAEGIPITPYDDAGRKNYYPMMKVTAIDRNTNAALASTNIVLPVSDEMDCRACHASGSGDAAKPRAGWVNDPNPQLDYRWNVLRLHDDRNAGSTQWTSALAALAKKGVTYQSTGLYDTAKGGKPILCALCHKSEALPVGGIAGIPPLTSAIHTRHAGVTDPATNMALGADSNRTACYRCHPGSETRCLRGTMGSAVAIANGVPELAMQCQNCHGAMSDVGAITRTGWLQEPTCQACHTGTATSNAGQIRYTSAGTYDPSTKEWIVRNPANKTFATNSDTPAAGFSLYRFSSGHGNLQCSACHGSTHAEYTSSHVNDNVQSIGLQGHVGTIAECGTCHTAGVPMTGNGGPHGMHPVGSWWVDKHHDYINGNLAQCQACHGTDYRGTVLSRAFAARTFSTELGTRQVFRGATVSCYMCHNGPFSSSATSNRAPVASNLSVSATSGAGLAIPLTATDPDANTLTLRIVSQPAKGMVAMDPTAPGRTAIYRPYVGASGTDTFTFAAWDGSIDSNLATVTVNLTACTIDVAASAPTTATLNSPVSFSSNATSPSCGGTASYAWTFGDGGKSTAQNPSHAYTTTGTFTWTLTATVAGVTATRSGNITVSGGTTTCTLTATATVPATGRVGTPVAFSSTVSTSGCSGAITYDWDFGDGSAHAATQNASHTYASVGTYTWRLQATASGVTSTRTGNIVISRRRGQNR